VYWWGRDAVQVWPVVTAVLIVACPCALALSMPFAYGHVIRLLGKRGLFLRDAEVVERLSRIDAVIFDKTGTLTSRETYAILFDGAALTLNERSMIRSLARNSAHPLSAALYHVSDEPLREAVFVEEHAGLGIEGTVNGVTVRLGNASFCDAPEALRLDGEAQVHVSIGGVPRGLFRMRKQAREGIGPAVRDLATSVDTFLLTGDGSVDPALAGLFGGDRIRTSCSPSDKTAVVAALQERGHRVLMVGDGLNDAGALARSDVGITVSESSAAFTPASDGIMSAKSLHLLPGMVKLTRRAHRIVLASLCLSLLYNITGVSFAVSGHLTPLIAAILMPLSSVSVVGFVSLAVAVATRRSLR
jgi:Cu+-exporting ATPase